MKHTAVQPSHLAEEPVLAYVAFQVILIDILKVEFSCYFYTISQFIHNRSTAPRLQQCLILIFLKKRQ